MPRQQLNVRVSLETRRTLHWLCRDFQETEGEMVARALDRLYQEVIRRYENPDPVTQSLILDEQIEEIEAREEEQWSRRDSVDYEAVLPPDEIEPDP